MLLLFGLGGTVGMVVVTAITLIRLTFRHEGLGALQVDFLIWKVVGSFGMKHQNVEWLCFRQTPNPRTDVHTRPTNQPTNQPTKPANKQTNKPAKHNTNQQTTNKQTKQTSKRTNQQTNKQQTKQTSQQASKQASKEVSKQTSQQAGKQASRQAGKHSSKQTRLKPQQVRARPIDESPKKNTD